MSDSILHAISKVIGWIYRMAFGGFEEFLYRRDRRRFIHEIKEDFAWLLAKHHGHIVAHEGEHFPRAFDYVAVVVELQKIRATLTRGRGELDARMASISDPHRLWDLSLICHRVDPSHPVPSVFGKHELARVASAIQERFDDIAETVNNL